MQTRQRNVVFLCHVNLKKYLEAVSSVGGEFFTLVVETTGGFSVKAAQLVRAIERDCGAPGELFRQVAATIMHWNGAIVANSRLPKTLAGRV